jgi:hypothetical protein
VSQAGRPASRHTLTHKRTESVVRSLGARVFAGVGPRERASSGGGGGGQGPGPPPGRCASHTRAEPPSGVVRATGGGGAGGALGARAGPRECRVLQWLVT